MKTIVLIAIGAAAGYYFAKKGCGCASHSDSTASTGAAAAASTAAATQAGTSSPDDLNPTMTAGCTSCGTLAAARNASLSGSGMYR